MGVQCLLPYISRTARFWRLLLSITTFHLKSKSSAALSLCPSHLHTLRPTFTTLRTLHIVRWSPTITPCAASSPFCPDCSLWWRNPSFVQCNASICTLPHSGGGHQQPLQIPKNRAASTVRCNWPKWYASIITTFITSLFLEIGTTIDSFHSSGTSFLIQIQLKSLVISERIVLQHAIINYDWI